MLDLIRQQAQEPQRRLSFGLARTIAEVAEAQRIRYKVFGEEMGAKLPSAETGLDIDRFDEFCDHLLVRDHSNEKVVGTYRILPPDQAYVAGGYYSETEFDLSRLHHLR
ncbi:MAG: GNAT family N-acetyltransferase, partial [Pseudomonadota bacterium]